MLIFTGNRATFIIMINVPSIMLEVNVQAIVGISDKIFLKSDKRLIFNVKEVYLWNQGFWVLNFGQSGF